MLEEKEFALAWHYRLVEPEFGDWIANELAANLEAQLAGTELAVLRGSKVVEVRFAWANKGEVAAHLRVDPRIPAGSLRSATTAPTRTCSSGWAARP